MNHTTIRERVTALLAQSSLVCAGDLANTEATHAEAQTRLLLKILERLESMDGTLDDLDKTLEGIDGGIRDLRFNR